MVEAGGLGTCCEQWQCVGGACWSTKVGHPAHALQFSWLARVVSRECCTYRKEAPQTTSNGACLLMRDARCRGKNEGVVE